MVFYAHEASGHQRYLSFERELFTRFFVSPFGHIEFILCDTSRFPGTALSTFCRLRTHFNFGCPAQTAYLGAAGVDAVASE